MPIYNYIATRLTGEKVEGKVDAKTQDLALGLLRNENLHVISLVEQQPGILDQIFHSRGVSEREIVSFTRQFSSMTSAGLPLTRTLEILTKQSDSKNMNVVVSSILRDVEAGSPLSLAMSKYPHVFSKTYQALIRAGESSGKLDVILKRLADTLEANRDINSKFKAAMIYPTIILVAMVGVFVLMMVFVIPKLADLYASLAVELPLMTQIMIKISRFMTANMYATIGGAALFVFGVRYFLESDTGKESTSYLAYHAPVFGKINNQKELAAFARTLGLLISSGVPIVESLKIVAEVVQAPKLQDLAMGASVAVEKGMSLSDFFKANPNTPSLFGQMAAVGEETGELDATLEKVAEYFEGEVKQSVAGLSAALEPIILIVLGAMVGLLIISIITPIYKITSSI